MKIYMTMFVILLICSNFNVFSTKIQPPYYNLVTEVTTPMTTEINSRLNLPTYMYYHRELLKRSQKENFFSFRDTGLSSNNLLNTVIKVPVQIAMLEVDFNLQNVLFQTNSSEKITFNLYLDRTKIASQIFKIEYTIVRGITIKGQAFNVPAGPHTISIRVEAPNSDGSIAFFCSNNILINASDIKSKCNSNNVDIIKGYVEVVGIPLK